MLKVKYLNLIIKKISKMQTSFSSQKCKQYINKMFDDVVIPELAKFIEIPNTSKSFDPEWATNGLLQKAALHIKSYVDSLQIKGAKCEMIKHQGYTPILFTEVEGDIKDRTIFFYGHFDKQPHMLNAGWDANKGPTKAVIENGKLYGRGGADDGYSTYSSMLAIKTCQEQGIPIPRCVMLTQGDEQSGGHIDYYIEAMRQRIGNPQVIFCLDSGTYDYQRLWLTTSLRGMVAGVLKVSNIREGVHSGDGSGIVPSVSRIADLIVQRMENLQTGKICQDFWVDVPPNRYAEAIKLSKIIGQGKVKDFALVQGMQTVTNNVLDLILNRTWRPQLTVTGISGLSPVSTAGNVLIPELKLRLSLRLPPTFNKKVSEERFKDILTENPPFGAHVTVSDLNAGQGWNAPDMSLWLLDTLEESSKIYYGNEMGGLGEGGSIPLMGLLSQMWPKAQFVITGVLGPASNAHGPNEFMHIDYTKKITMCMAHVLAKAHTVNGN